MFEMGVSIMMLIDSLWGVSLAAAFLFNQFFPVDSSAVVIRNDHQAKDVVYFRKGENFNDTQSCLYQQFMDQSINRDLMLLVNDYGIGRLGTALLVEDSQTVKNLETILKAQGITLKRKIMNRSSIKNNKRASDAFAKKLQKHTSCDECKFLGIFVPVEAVSPNQGLSSWVSSWFCGKSLVSRDSMKSPCAVGDFIADARLRAPGKTQYIIADSRWYFNVNKAGGMCPGTLNDIYENKGFNFGRSCKPTKYQDVGILIQKSTEWLWFKLEQFIVSGASCVPN
ncbi:hypothetical protein CI610_00087 [invertebrate metagenome]|uniref:Uncharacterized protein n=1 Tax=invertebrate metagenome TaxID=1711999 RepID=A0A2H9TCM0_9ZZZZ